MSGCGFARRGSMGTAPLSLDSIDKEQQEWGAQASAPSRHVAAKHPFWRLGQNIQLKTMLLVSSLAAAFVLLRCYHQLTAVNISGKGSLRSLARLIQVTKDCSSVAVMLPSPFLMKLGDLFLGLCIQEVAALSTLLEDQFDRQKADVLQTAMDAAHELMRVSQQRDNNAQLLHASRLLKFARRLLNPEVKDSPLAKSVRLRMLTELLALQEAALGLIETAVSSALKSLHSKRHATAELINELFEELRRVIYTRRRHVFKSKHLSRHLRRYERGYNRAVMMGIRDIQRLDEEPDTTFEAKLAELRDTKAWIKMPLEKTRRLLLEAAHQKEGHPAKQQELQLIAEAANEMLESIRSEAQRTDMQGMAVPHSWSSVGGASLFTPSSLTRGRTNQASGIYNWSGTDGRRGAVSLGGQGIAHREEMMQGPLGPLSAVPSLQELLEQAQIEEALGGSPWFGIDSDRG
ncbi:LOW QUALITY PROTEIN: uncharacterized protein EMH_0056240 [Eimeria mitis]|uniref:Uncharacterized protein n=1 Tax=Eimeria mitis TaxID=44415 RepID=U6K1N0_9EIME|nr:LOW QUALITY PROTEIN: uncharacterized protein EMH_0056240 [Eimeria mitis]CDJ30227.1 hypothetical protein EMH_0056240 [Eimeria mitis]